MTQRYTKGINYRDLTESTLILSNKSLRANGRWSIPQEWPNGVSFGRKTTNSVECASQFGRTRSWAQNALDFCFGQTKYPFREMKWIRENDMYYSGELNQKRAATFGLLSRFDRTSLPFAWMGDSSAGIFFFATQISRGF